MTFDTLILAVAAALFVVALIALSAWAFKTFFPGRRDGQGFMRREKRLGVVETANIDQKRKLFLIRRDADELLVMIAGPDDLVVESGIKGRAHPAPPLEVVNSKRSETRLGTYF